MLEKNKSYEMDIVDIGKEGEGIGKIDGFTIFVENAVLGDKIEVLIIKLLKQYGFGKLLRIITPSKDRVESKCQVFSQCGGCSLQQMSYDSQLLLKNKMVMDTLKRIGGFNCPAVSNIETIGMDNPYNYRNKMHFPISEHQGKAVVGMYQKKSHSFIPIKKCLTMHPVHEDIIMIINRFLYEKNILAYNEQTHNGLVRHLLIRIGFHTNEIMVCLVINGKTLPYSNHLVNMLREIPNMKSIILNQNEAKTNVPLGNISHTIWGSNYITDYISSEGKNTIFQISLPSFFQVNPIQTAILYKKILEFANISQDSVVIDAYCGIGTISILAAQRAKKVIGIEIVQEAVNDAIKNAKINHIHNIEFIAGKVEKILPELTNINIDSIILDPPRKGCETALISAVLAANPKVIIYVSCDPATLARDLKILCSGKYRLIFVQPVDMFPITNHVETVVLMSSTTTPKIIPSEQRDKLCDYF